MKKFFNHTKRPVEAYNPNDYDMDYEDMEEDFDTEEMLEDSEQGEDYLSPDGYYNEDGEWVEAADGYYDENGEWVETADGYYDENGEWVEIADGYYDENGEWVETAGGYYDENGEWVEAAEDYCDENGEKVGIAAASAEDTEEAEDASEDLEQYIDKAAVLELAEAEGYIEEFAGDEAAEEEELLYEDVEEEAFYTEDTEEDEPIDAADAEEDEDEGPGFFALLTEKLSGINLMDYMIVFTSIFVVILAVVIGGVFLARSAGNGKNNELLQVGRQLEDIDLVGEEGILAIGQATQNRIQAQLAEQERLEQEKKEEEDRNNGYEENDYNKSVSVNFSLTSVLKDLKVKITNKSTKKLIASVPFSIVVTDEKGNEQTWQDDDRDGIIYKDGIAPGNYEVKMLALDDQRYDKYSIPSGVQSVIVKKDIAYTKVDVSNEIKKESEVDSAKEDTKKNETQIESVLPDTVTWVESTVTGNTYIEVPKSSIPDPVSLIVRGNFLKTALPVFAAAPGLPGAEPSVEPSVALSAEPSVAPSVEPSVEPSVAPSAEPSVAPSAEPSVAPSTEPSVEPSTAPSTEPSVDPSTSPSGETSASGSESGESGESSESSSVEAEKLKPITAVTLTPSTVTLYADKNASKPRVANVLTKATGQTEGKALSYTLGSYDSSVVDASINKETGEIGLIAKAVGSVKIPVVVNYKENGTSATQKSAELTVKVVAEPVLKLDQTQMTIVITKENETKKAVTAIIENAAVSAPVITGFKSDNEGYLRVEQDATNKNKLYLTGVAEGSAKVIVTYTVDGITKEAACAVVIKKNPKDDKTTELKDNEKRTIYVYDGGKYRVAAQADYYAYSQFFVMGEPKYTGWQTLNGKLYFFNSDGKAVTGEQVIQGAKYNFASDGSLVTSSGTMGIDVSKWNGTIDWNAVKNSGVSYVIIRCGYRGSSKGTLIEDPKYRENIKGATAAGLKVGVYFFTQAINQVEAVEEASMVLECVKNYKISYPIFLDVEASGGRADSLDRDTRTAIIKTFCETIRTAGYTPGVYANKNWLTNKMNADELNAYKIWLAQYAAAPTYTGKFELWQYKDTGKVSGISGNVDLNISYLGY